MSESGDNYGPFVFAQKPSNEQLRYICEYDWCHHENSEDDRGAGDFGSNIYLTAKECEVN